MRRDIVNRLRAASELAIEEQCPSVAHMLMDAAQEIEWLREDKVALTSMVIAMGGKISDENLQPKKPEESSREASRLADCLRVLFADVSPDMRDHGRTQNR